MREVIYDELPVTARIQLHRRVGEAIEQLHGDDPRPYLAQLAHHFAKVAPAGEGEKARDYARRAGDQAMDARAYEEAVLGIGAPSRHWGSSVRTQPFGASCSCAWVVPSFEPATMRRPRGRTSPPSTSPGSSGTRTG